MQTIIKSIFISVHIFSSVMGHHSFGEDPKSTSIPDTGQIAISNRIDLIEIIEQMDQRSIEENYSLIAKVDSTILRCIPSINPISPTSKPYFTSRFGKRVHPISGQLRDHNGIDIATELSFQYVHSTADGVVEHVAFSNSAGIFVRINHIAGYSTTYMHLAGADVQIGEQVKIGQIIGWMGASGRVTAKHVHYEIKKKGRAINPLPYLDLYNRCLQSSLSEKER